MHVHAHSGKKRPCAAYFCPSVRIRKLLSMRFRDSYNFHSGPRRVSTLRHIEEQTFIDPFAQFQLTALLIQITVVFAE